MKKMTLAAALVTMAVLLTFGCSTPRKNLAAETFATYVDDWGEISLPEDYRRRWVHLGSWVVPDEKAPGYGFHDVYTQPGVPEAFKKNGKFPDGTVLVKEIRTEISAKMTTGENSYAGENLVWFVMIKDAMGRYQGHSNWGDGWGWALYEAKDPGKNVSTDYSKDCIGCHIPARETDWVYIQGYPTLK